MQFVPVHFDIIAKYCFYSSYSKKSAKKSVYFSNTVTGTNLVVFKKNVDFVTFYLYCSLNKM